LKLENVQYMARAYVNRRGIPAKPILNGYCGDYDWDMQHDETATIGTTVSSVTTTGSTSQSSCNEFATKLLALGLLVAFVTSQ